MAKDATSQGADPPDVRGTIKCARQSGGPAGYAISSGNGLFSGLFAQLRHMPLSGCPPHRGARFRGVPARARLRPSSQRKAGDLYAAFSVATTKPNASELWRIVSALNILLSITRSGLIEIQLIARAHAVLRRLTCNRAPPLA
jgi:hypothetical protein